MGFFRNQPGELDGGVPPATSVGHAPDDSGTISHDPNLVEALRADHAQLGIIYTRIGELVEAAHYDALGGALLEFKSLLQKHMLIENVYFYAYLKQSMPDEPANADCVHEFRRDMNVIAREVFLFVETWRNVDFAAPDASDRFRSDYRAVGAALEQRLDSEETSLYPLYKPC